MGCVTESVWTPGAMLYAHVKQIFAFWMVAFEQVVAVNARLFPRPSGSARSLDATHTDSHSSGPLVVDARGRREAVAAAVRGQQGGYRNFETRGGLLMPNAKVEARRNEKRIVAFEYTRGSRKR